MASPLEIYAAWQSRQTAGDFEHLGEVVDLEGFRDICIGLSDWATGYQAAFENLKRNILIPLADWHSTVETDGSHHATVAGVRHCSHAQGDGHL